VSFFYCYCLFDGKKRCLFLRAVTAIGRHVERLKIVIMACGSFNFFSLVFEEKSPIELGIMF
jgi:hypothetical protein